MIEEQRVARVGSGAGADYIAFRQTGEDVDGSFRCAECGYGVVVASALPACPMCGSTVWEDSDWSSVGRSPLL